MNESVSARKKTLHMVQTAMLIALIVALQVLSTALSRAALLPFNLTLTMIPILVGALLYGIGEGAILGAVFGIVVMILGFTGYDPTCAPLIEANVFCFVAICLIKGIAAGAAAGAVGKLLRKRMYIAALAAAVVAPVVNTGLFLLGMRFCYYDLMVLWADGKNLVYYMLIVLAGINFLVELGVNLILSPAVTRIVKQAEKM